MTRLFNGFIERDSEGYFVASLPELRGCHTQAKSLDKLMQRIKEAIELCLLVVFPPTFLIDGPYVVDPKNWTVPLGVG